MIIPPLVMLPVAWVGTLTVLRTPSCEHLVGNGVQKSAAEKARGDWIETSSFPASSISSKLRAEINTPAPNAIIEAIMRRLSGMNQPTAGPSSNAEPLSKPQRSA